MKLRTLGAQASLPASLQTEQAGMPALPGLIVQNDSSASIRSVISTART